MEIQVKADLTPAVEGVRDFLDDVFGPASKEIGELLGNQIRFWKQMNLSKLSEKLRRELEQRKLTPEQIQHLRMDQAVPLIEAASYESSDEIQELWARLLANALDPNVGLEIEKYHIAILKELSRVDAVHLELLAKHAPLRKPGHHPSELVELAESDFRNKLGIFSNEQRSTSIINLRRIGLITPVVNAPEFGSLLRRVQLGGLSSITTVDERAFQDFLQWLSAELTVEAGTGSDRLDSNAGFWMNGKLISIPELSTTLTPLGSRLMAAVTAPAT